MKKRSLTPREKLQATYEHICLEYDQHTIAARYGINQGRISEAVSAIKEAVGFED